MNKSFGIVISLLILIILASLIYLLFSRQEVHPPIQNNQIDKASPATQSATGDDEIFKNALNLFLRKKEDGLDMSNGPCLGKIGEDWVLDIAHNPRQPVDDRKENQCEDFREGAAHHFIELNPEGKLIKMN